MPPEVLKLLEDILNAAGSIQEFTKDKDLDGYRSDEMCRAAVERKFEIIGEACTRLRDRHPQDFSKLEHGANIIGLRNRVIHGYDCVDDAILWDAIHQHLPDLVKEIATLED